jgi:hypothetical protein
MMKSMLPDAMNYAREDVGKIEDPEGQALFETTTEALGGSIRTAKLSRVSMRILAGDRAKAWSRLRVEEISRAGGDVMRSRRGVFSP